MKDIMKLLLILCLGFAVCEDGVKTLPKGAKIGTLIHKIFERLDFNMLGEKSRAGGAEKYIEEICKILGEKYPVSTQKANTSIADLTKKLQELKKTGKKVKDYLKMR